MITLMRGASLAETTAFVTVVELKSFAKAAKQLALSPPRVSEMCTGRSRSRRRSPAAKLSRAAPGQIAFGFLEIIADGGSRLRTADLETLSFCLPRRAEVSDEPTNPARPKK